MNKAKMLSKAFDFISNDPEIWGLNIQDFGDHERVIIVSAPLIKSPKPSNKEEVKNEENRDSKDRENKVLQYH